MVPTNRELLTKGQKYQERAHRKNQVQEVTFNKEDRSEFLTGFHKRKVQRQKVAKSFKEKQLHQQRLEERKRIREERKLAIQEKLELLKQARGGDDEEEESEGESEGEEQGDDDSNDEDIEKSEKSEKSKKSEKSEETEKTNEDESSDEWKGFSDDESTKGILKKKVVYSNLKNEDSETTVTIESLLTDGAEPVDLYKLAKLNNVELEKSETVLNESVKRAKKYAELVKAPVKPKKRKFRYLSKSERAQNNRKARRK